MISVSVKREKFNGAVVIDFIVLVDINFANTLVKC